MIAAVIAASAVMAGLIGLAVTLSVWLRAANQEAAMLREDKLVEMRRGDDLIDQRDGFSNDVKRLLAENQDLRGRLVAVQEQRNELVAEEVKHVVTRIRESTDPVDAARQIDELLKAPLRRTTATDTTGAGGDPRD